MFNPIPVYGAIAFYLLLGPAAAGWFCAGVVLGEVIRNTHLTFKK